MSWLYAELKQAKSRVAYCERELRRARGELNPCGPQALRTISKLEDDLRAAQKDAAWFALQVEDAEAGAKANAAYHGRSG